MIAAMKGSPLGRALVMIVPLLFLAWPLAQVTRGHAFGEAKTVSRDSKPSAREFRADLILKTSHPFEKVTFRAGEKSLVWKKGETYGDLVLPIVAGELLCELEVVWQEKPARAALSLELVPDFLPGKVITIWSENEREFSETRVLDWNEKYFTEENGGDHA